MKVLGIILELCLRAYSTELFERLVTHCNVALLYYVQRKIWNRYGNGLASVSKGGTDVR